MRLAAIPKSDELPSMGVLAWSLIRSDKVIDRSGDMKTVRRRPRLPFRWFLNTQYVVRQSSRYAETGPAHWHAIQAYGVTPQQDLQIAKVGSCAMCDVQHDPSFHQPSYHGPSYPEPPFHQRSFDDPSYPETSYRHPALHEEKGLMHWFNPFNWFR